MRRSRLIALILAGLAGLAGTPAFAGPNDKKPPTKKGDLGGVISQLGDADAEVAVRAAQTLAESSEPSSHEALLDALAFGMPPPVAAAAIAALAQHPAPPDVTALRRYARHHNPNVRVAALTALAMYPSPDSHQQILAGLRDGTQIVRAAAAAACAKGRVRASIEPLFALLAKNEDAAGKALAQMADPELAAKIADHLGQVPDPILAQTLGAILKRPDFGPDPARVEVVRALGKVKDRAADLALGDYVDSTPKNPPRASRQEAEKMLDARRGGGK